MDGGGSEGGDDGGEALGLFPLPLPLPRPTPSDQGLTLAHLRAQLEDLQDTSLTLELNLSSFGTHPRVDLGYMGDEVRLSRAERGKVSSN
jgi:hypothetical protein